MANKQPKIPGNTKRPLIAQTKAYKCSQTAKTMAKKQSKMLGDAKSALIEQSKTQKNMHKNLKGG